MLEFKEFEGMEIATPEAINLAGAERVKALPKKDDWQCQVVPVPREFFEDLEGPEDVPCFLMAVEDEFGSRLPLHKMPNYREAADDMVNDLIRFLLDLEFCPESFMVCEERTRALLTPLGEILEIPVVMMEELDMMEDAYQEFYQLGMPDDLDSGAAGGLMDGLGALGGIDLSALLN